MIDVRYYNKDSTLLTLAKHNSYSEVYTSSPHLYIITQALFPQYTLPIKLVVSKVAMATDYGLELIEKVYLDFLNLKPPLLLGLVMFRTSNHLDLNT